MSDAKMKGYYRPWSLRIELWELDSKYQGKELKLSLYYWMRLLNHSKTSYRREYVHQFIYEWQNEITLDVNLTQDWYRGRTIFIGYFVEIDLWKKMLLFSDKQRIELEWRGDYVYHAENLERQLSGVYRDHVDQFRFTEVIKSSHIITKIIFVILLAVFLWMLFSWVQTLIVSTESWWEKWFNFLFTSLWGLWIIWIPTVVMYHLMGRWYIDLDFNISNVKDSSPISEILIGKAKRALDEIEVQVFCLNEERSWYEKQSGSTTRTIHIKKEVGNVLLYSKQIYKINAGDSLKDYLTWTLDFDKIYEKLSPSIEYGDHMWLYTCLEVRIISKNQRDIVKKEVIRLDSKKFTNRL